MKNYFTDRQLNITYEGTKYDKYRWTQHVFYDRHDCFLCFAMRIEGIEKLGCLFVKVFALLCLLV